jgi:hypothetical protein
MVSGFVVFHLPLVKSGNFWGVPPLATDISLKGETALQRQPS